MNGKKIIKTAIAAYVVVGITGLGVGAYMDAAGSEKNASFDSISDQATIEEVKSADEYQEETEPVVEAVAEEPVLTTETESEKPTSVLEESPEEIPQEAEEEPKEELPDVDTPTEDVDITSDRTFYRYAITSNFDLFVYDDPDVPASDESHVMGEIPAGTTGYAIEQGHRRTLIEYNGYYGYVSNLYCAVTEVSASEYPAELKGITADNVTFDETGWQ